MKKREKMNFNMQLEVLKRSNIIIVVGIPGCGKTSVLEEVKRQAGSVHIVNYGDKMLEEGALAGLDRDKIRKLPLADLQGIGRKAAKKIASECDGLTIVDTHALIRTPLGFCPGLPHDVLALLQPKAIAWIECSPATILARRSQDASRNRDIEPKGELALHQELTKNYVAACSMTTGAILCPIYNDGPSIAQNALPLVQLIQSF